MKKIVFFLTCMLCMCGYAQETNVEPSSEEEIFMVVETMPEFPGGQKALFRYLSENVKYPVIAQENGIQGRVIVQFVVDKDGSITNVEVVKSDGDASLEKEAVRVIKSMPKWIPGRQRNEAVRVKYTVPVNFLLTGGNKKPSQASQPKSVEVHVGDTIYPLSGAGWTALSGYCGDSIFFIKAPDSWDVNLKVDKNAVLAGYFVITGGSNGIYNFTRYMKDVVTERGIFKISSLGEIQYLDTMYCYKQGNLVEAILYTSVDNANTVSSSVIHKAMLYDDQEQLLREYSFKPAHLPQNLSFSNWKEYYEGGCYSIHSLQKGGIKSNFYSLDGKKASVKQPKLKTAKSFIQKQLQDSVKALLSNDEFNLQVEIQFYVDEAGNGIMARCGTMSGQFSPSIFYSQNIFNSFRKEADRRLKRMSFEFEPGTVNKTPQRMFHTIKLKVHNNSKLVMSHKENKEVPNRGQDVYEGDTVWMKATRANKLIYKGDTIRFSMQYTTVPQSTKATHYAIIHEKEDSLVEWHVYSLTGDKTAILRHNSHKMWSRCVGLQDYYRNNRLLCSENNNKSENSLQIVWFNYQGKKEKEYLLTGDKIVRQCNLYKEDGQLSSELFYYPDYVIGNGYKYDDNGEKYLFKPEKKEIPWHIGDTVALRLIKPTYEDGNDVKMRYFMYRDEYIIDNKQDDVDVYGVVEAVRNDTLWVTGYDQGTGVKTCNLCYCSRIDGSLVHEGLQIYYDTKGLPMSGVTYQLGIPIRSHWYKSDGTEYLRFELMLSDPPCLIPLQMTWLAGSSCVLPTIKAPSSLIKTLNKSLDLKSFEPYYGTVIVLLIVDSDGAKRLLLKIVNFEPKKETLAKQSAANEIEKSLENILASWAVAPAKVSGENVSMPMVLMFDFNKSDGFVSVQSAHQGAKYDK